MLISALLLQLTGCGKNDTANESKAQGQMWQIGVCHSNNDEYEEAIMEGFSKALSDELSEDSITYTREYITEEKSGTSIAGSFIRSGSDLILTIGEDALRDTAAATEDIPIITTDVIDILDTIGMESTDQSLNTGRNITGITGMPVIPDQLALILEVTPDIDTLAIIYSRDDRHSIAQSRIMQSYLQEAGVDHIQYQLGDVSKKKLKSICKKCDAIYIPADSLLYKDSKKISKIAATYGIPTVGGDVRIGKNTLAALCPNYYEIGYKAGQQAAQILGHGKDPARMPLEFNTSAGIKLYNKTLAEKMGLTFPKSFQQYGHIEWNTSSSDR